MATLFVNACMRGRASRTMTLCQAHLQKCQTIEEVNLAGLGLRPFTAEDISYRTRVQKKGAWDDPIFTLAKQFASADEIVIGAPYWDLSFPSALKVYVEHISVNGITFQYTSDAICEGMCKARRLVYLTSSGGMLEGANFGYQYFKGVAKMFGIPHTHFVAAQGLDIVGCDIEKQMRKALDEVDGLGK